MQMKSAEAAAGHALKESRDALAGRVSRLYFAAHPQMEARWKNGRQKCTEDTGRHLDCLSDALCFAQPALFLDYAAWAATLLENLKIPCEALVSNLLLLKDSVAVEVGGAGARFAGEYIDAAIAKVEGGGRKSAGYLEGSGRVDVLAREYLGALLRGERRAASTMILTAVEEKIPVKQIYLDVFQRSLREIGRLWQVNEINVAEEHYCTASTQLILSQLYPYIFTGKRNGGTFVGTCVSGDLHEIGGRMIADFLEMAGWNAFYLGASTPADSVVKTLIDRKADLLGVSATITTHVGSVEELIRTVRAEPDCAGVKILAGGYPFNVAPELWRSVGADGCAVDAESVAEIAAKLTGRDYESG